MYAKLLDVYLVMHVSVTNCNFWGVDMEYKRFALEQWYDKKDTAKDISESGMIHFGIMSVEDILNSISWKEFAYYGEIAGEDEFRDLIALIYRCDKENVLVTNGASEAVFIALESLLDINDEIICVLPYYNSIHNILKNKHIRVVECGIEIDNLNVFFDNLMDLISENTKAILLSSINNPTGAKLTYEQYYKLVDIASYQGVYVILDDVFAELTDFGNEYLFDYSNLERVIHINSMSKSYAVPGLRIGWAISNANVIKQFANTKSYISENVSVILQRCGINILMNREKLLHQNRKILKTNLNILKRKIATFDDLSLVEPCGGCCCLIKYDFPIDSFSLCENIYDKTGILLAPGAAFGYEYCFRIGYGVDTEFFQNILNELMEYIQKWRKMYYE